MKASQTITPLLWLRKKTDSTGIVKIRVTENRKSTYVSLGYSIPAKHWNDNAKEVRKTDAVDYAEINKKIKEKVRELEDYSSQEGYSTKKNPLSYLDYFENVFVAKRTKHGTANRYMVIFRKIKAFLKKQGKKDLLFSEIDNFTVSALRKHLSIGCSINTSNNYFHVTKTALNEAIEDGLVNYLRHPYTGIKTTDTKVRKTPLDKDEIIKLLKCPIDETDFLFNIKINFVSQIFLQGMRATDLGLLRWGMIEGENINYTMLKTGQSMSIHISDIVWQLLILRFKQITKKENIKDLGYILHLENELAELEKKRIEQHRLNGVVSGFDMIQDKVGDNYLISPELVNDIEITKKTLFINYKDKVRRLAESPKFKNEFIFTIFENMDFSNIKKNDFTQMTKEQYEKTRWRIGLYNRNLKSLQARAGIKTNITSHLSRHSYAFMLLSNDVNLQDIKHSLGHSDYNITERYITELKGNNMKTVNNMISNQYV